MTKKKSETSAADSLIDSLMEDLKDLPSEDNFEGLPLDGSDENRVENTSVLSGNLWQGLDDADAGTEEGLGYSPESEMPSSDFEMPEGFHIDAPSLEEEKYQGPSAEGGYQYSDEIANAASPPARPGSAEDKTVSIHQDLNLTSPVVSSTLPDAEKTVAVDGFANARLGARRSEPDVKVSVGNFRGGPRGSANVMTSVDASLAQAENLKIAQQRILELEKEVEILRAENEELASAGEIIRSRTDELGVRITAVEREKAEDRESFQSEILILKGNLQYKENEVAKARLKIEELETRLKSDFKKIRVRERELENRLELLRAEKAALVRSKDEYILEQKRKIDQLSQELDNYRKKCLELNKTIEANQDQVKRTERALRLALTNLEAKEENVVPLKKAE